MKEVIVFIENCGLGVFEWEFVLILDGCCWLFFSLMLLLGIVMGNVVDKVLQFFVVLCFIGFVLVREVIEMLIFVVYWIGLIGVCLRVFDGVWVYWCLICELIFELGFRFGN